MRAAVLLGLGAAGAYAVGGCGFLVGVDWDRVAVNDAGAVSTLPDGAPAPPGSIPPGGSSSGGSSSGGSSSGGTGGDGGVADAAVTCTPPQISCVVGCCTDDIDPGLPTGLTAGQGNTCAITTTGKVRCWGSNNVGQLGRGQGNDSLTPVTAYRMPQGVTRAAMGMAHGCAVVGAYVGCWGANGSGQVGFDGSPQSLGTEEPGRVQKISGTTIALALGSNFTCAAVDGTGYCWGDNADGQLATSPATYRSSVPLTIGQLGSGVTAVGAAGNEACAVAGGAVSCWGGSGGNPPTKVAGVSGATAIGVGSLHKCALAGGTVLCWGSPFYSVLGNNAADGRTPTAPTALPTNVTQLAVGGTHSCALAGTDVWCWGANISGELGRDTGASNSGLPAKVAAAAGATAIAVGDSHSCALLANNKIKCWGSNGFGQLGNGTKDSGFTAVDVTWP